MTKITDLTDDGSWRTFESDVVQTYYIGGLFTNTLHRSVCDGVRLARNICCQKRVFVSFSNFNGDRPSKNYGKGTLPVVAKNLTGTVNVADSRGNPVPNFPVIIDFFTVSPRGSGTIARAGDYTGENGTFYLNLEIPVWPCQNEVEGVLSFFRYSMSPYRVYRNYAELRITVADGYTLNGTTKKDVYQYGAEFYIG